MRTGTSGNFRRWKRHPATLPSSLVLKAENFIEDHAAFIIDFSVGGVGVLTSLALVPGERVRIVASVEFPEAIPARVAWVREDQDECSNWNFAGLEFLDT